MHDIFFFYFFAPPPPECFRFIAARISKKNNCLSSFCFLLCAVLGEKFKKNSSLFFSHRGRGRRSFGSSRALLVSKTNTTITRFTTLRRERERKRERERLREDEEEEKKEI